MKPVLLSAALLLSAGCFHLPASDLLVPQILGTWTTIAENPNLGDLKSDKQQPVDFGIWQAALAQPARAAEWVVATEGDDVSKAIAAHPEGLQTMTVLHVQGKRPVTIYRTLRQPR